MASAIKNPRLLRKLLRDFSVNVKPWSSAIYHQVKPDEPFNAPLIAMLAYGDPKMHHVVTACAGLDSPEQEIKAMVVVLPSWSVYFSLLSKSNGE